MGVVGADVTVLSSCPVLPLLLLAPAHELIALANTSMRGTTKPHESAMRLIADDDDAPARAPQLRRRGEICGRSVANSGLPSGTIRPGRETDDLGGTGEGVEHEHYAAVLAQMGDRLDPLPTRST